MRKIKKIAIEADSETLSSNKRVKFVSPGIAIRNRTWTGFGKGAGLLGYESDDINESGDLPNIEDVNFVNELFVDDDKIDSDIIEGAE